MTDLRTAAQQALEALEKTASYDIPPTSQVRSSITALRAALKQPEQEPVALCDPAEYDDFQGAVSRNCAAANSPKRHAPVTMETVYETIIHWDEGGGKRSRRELARRIVDLYTHPPRREWRGLTDEQLLYVYNELPNWGMDMDSLSPKLKQFARAIEAALKERNV